MKGQMFIITMVFLIGLVFAVQNNLSAYNFLDLAKAFEKNDLYLLEGIKISFNEALKYPTCSETEKNLRELADFLEERIIGGTSIEIDYSFSCPPKNLSLTIHLKSIEMDTRETLEL
jgi:hypothetical protein